MKKILLQHYKDYPQAKLQDFFKFIHQSEFGPAHLISNPKENFKRLKNEFAQLDPLTKDKIVDFLQPNLCRLHLQVLTQSSLNITTLQRFFELSTTPRGTIDSYYEKIEILKELCIEGVLPFTEIEVNRFKDEIGDSPLLPFRHSKNYRLAYAPAYRVVEKRFYDVLPLFSRIDELMSKNEHVVVAIDGDCAAGKTTLAKLLKDVYNCNIIHMDHFFLRPEQRTKERLIEPGGNIDYKRFDSEVLVHLNMKNSFSYRPFNCTTQDFDPPISLFANKLTIIEGSYSHHPILTKNYDLKVFLSIPEDVQLERILKRNGNVMYEKFKNIWIPMEKKFELTFNIRKNSHLEFDYLDNH